MKERFSGKRRGLPKKAFYDENFRARFWNFFTKILFSRHFHHAAHSFLFIWSSSLEIFQVFCRWSHGFEFSGKKLQVHSLETIEWIVHLSKFKLRSEVTKMNSTVLVLLRNASSKTRRCFVLSNFAQVAMIMVSFRLVIYNNAYHQQSCTTGQAHGSR